MSDMTPGKLRKSAGRIAWTQGDNNKNLWEGFLAICADATRAADVWESELADARRQLEDMGDVHAAWEALYDIYDTDVTTLRVTTLRRQLTEAEEEEDAAWDDADRWHDRAVYAGRVLLDVLDYEDIMATDEECGEAFDRLPEWVKTRLEG